MSFLSFRRNSTKHLQIPGQLAGRIPHTSLAQGAGKFPLRPPGQQSGLGATGDKLETGPTVVPTEKQHPLFRDIGERGAQRRASLPEHRPKRPQPTKPNRRFVQRVPRSNQAYQHAETERKRRLLRLLEAPAWVSRSLKASTRLSRSCLSFGGERIGFLCGFDVIRGAGRVDGVHSFLFSYVFNFFSFSFFRDGD